MISYDIRNRLTTYLKSINLSISQLEELCGFSNRYFNNVRFRVPTGRIDIILRVLPDLNREWLLTGNGQMTRNLPSFTAPVQATDTVKDNTRFFQRVVILLEKEGLGLAEYEESHGMTRGTVRHYFEEGDLLAMDRVALSLLREYPKFSYDWLFLGKGKAIKIESISIPIVKYPSWLEHQNRVLEDADTSTKQKERTLLGVTRFYSNLPRLDVDAHQFKELPTFALLVQTHDLVPYAPWGSLLICQRKTLPFGKLWDPEALYVVEEKKDLPPDQYTPNQLAFGYVRPNDNGIIIEPYHGILALQGNTFGALDNDKIACIAKVVGIFRTKFPNIY